LSLCLLVWGGPTHHSVDRFEQFVLLDWLEQLGVDPQLAESGWVAWPLPGSQHHDACGGEFGSFPDHGGYRQAMRIGHAGIQQHQRVRSAVGSAVPPGVHGCHPVTHRHRVHLPTAQPLRQDVPVGGIVIDHQHGQVVERDGGLSRDRPRGVRLLAEARREGEGAAPGRVADTRGSSTTDFEWT
jgi:hypothetical protein